MRRETPLRDFAVARTLPGPCRSAPVPAAARRWHLPMTDNRTLSTGGDATGVPPGLAEDPNASYSMHSHDVLLGAGTGSDEATAPPGMVSMAASCLVTEAAGGDTFTDPRTGAGGVYDLRRLVGVGGMGEVWEAVQVSLGRLVAVKRIRADVLARAPDGSWKRAKEADFRHEALIASRLEHPNIVPVHDYGLDESGAPLLAMKLVDGDPWDQRLEDDLAALAPGDFLARHLPTLVDVGQAVAYAHSRGIIHRDIKPAQVMVGPFGEVLLMDWGLALYIGRPDARPERLGDAFGLPQLRTLETASNPSGTPALMAPEQAVSDKSGLGPWTDVYLLAGTLYYLLTGAYPHSAPSARLAMQHARRGEVEPPSQRAPGRNPPAELEQLCMQGLAADPAGRTESAGAFVSRIQDYISGANRRRQSRELADEAAAVLANARGDYRQLSHALNLASRGRELWNENPRCEEVERAALLAHAEAAIEGGDLRLARVQADRLPDDGTKGRLLTRVGLAEAKARAHRRQRHAALLVAAVLALALLAGGALSVARLSEANENIRRERDAAERQRALADESRALAEQQRRAGEDLISFMLVDLGGKLDNLNRLELMDDVARETIRHYSEAPEEGLSRTDRIRRASAYGELARVFEQRGDLRAAMDALRDSQAVWQDLVERDPGDAVAMGEYAGNLKFQAQLMMAGGDSRGALETFRKVAGIRRALAESNPDDTGILSLLSVSLAQLGGALVRLGEMEEAAEHLGEAIAISRQARTLSGGTLNTRLDHAFNLISLADLHMNSHRLSEAIELQSEAVAELRAVVQMAPDVPSHRRSLSVVLNHLGDGYLWSGDASTALAHFQEALALRAEAAMEDEENAEARFDLATAQGKVAAALIQVGNYAAGQQASDEQMRLMGELVDLDPANARWLVEYAIASTIRVGLYYRRGDLDQAFVAGRESLDLFGDLLAVDPANPEWLGHYTSAAQNLAVIANAVNRPAEAARAAAEARDGLESLVELEPRNAGWRIDLAGSWSDLGIAQAAAGDYTAARASLSNALELFDALTESLGDAKDWEAALAVRYHATAQTMYDLGDFDRAAAAYGRMARFYRDLVGRFPDRPRYAHQYAVWRADELQALSHGLPRAQVVAGFEEVIALLQDTAERFPGNLNTVLVIDEMSILALMTASTLRGVSPSDLDDVLERTERMADHLARHDVQEYMRYHGLGAAAMALADIGRGVRDNTAVGTAYGLIVSPGGLADPPRSASMWFYTVLLSAYQVMALADAGDLEGARAVADHFEALVREHDSLPTVLQERYRAQVEVARSYVSFAEAGRSAPLAGEEARRIRDALATLESGRSAHPTRNSEIFPVLGHLLVGDREEAAALAGELEGLDRVSPALGRVLEDWDVR